jgi:hypothetical protein
MKKVLKVLGIIIGGIIVIGIIGSLVSNGNDKTTTTKEQPVKVEQTQPTTTTPQQDTTQQQQPAAPTPAPAPAKKTSITKADFDKMQTGMTYEQVVQTIGVEGELMSESGDKGTQYYTVMYKWNGSGNLGANANAMFQGGKMISKAQFGLK